MTDLDKEFMDGYFDGRDLDCPWPSDNRHPAYIHSFKVGRAEKQGKPIPAWLSRMNAKWIEEKYKLS